MKLNNLTTAAAMALVALTGCVNPDGSTNHTGTGLLAGSLIGATSGAIIGGSMSHGSYGRHGGYHSYGGEGALIGAAVGALAGGLVGNSMDQAERARLQREAPQTYERVDQGEPLGLNDVKALAQSKISDDIIISQIRNSRTVYRLSAADIIDLRNAGVSNRVIDFMINTQTTQAAARSKPQPSVVYVAQPPPPVVVETVMVAPAPGYVWAGGEWCWEDRWVWSAGHWGYPPHPHSVWISGSWASGPRGWCHSPGRWR